MVLPKVISSNIEQPQSFLILHSDSHTDTKKFDLSDNCDTEIHNLGKHLTFRNDHYDCKSNKMIF